jgi:hypothetical protein
MNMDSKLLIKVESKELLAILTDKNNNIVWKSSKSPVSEMYKEYFRGNFSEDEPYILYTNQAGMAVGIILTKLNIVECHAVKMSECGLKLFKKSSIKFDYKELIPLVKSSKDENKVCPIEKFLSEHDKQEEQWNFLKERFKNNDEPHNVCEWNPNTTN